ncbi:Histidine kinase-, DNA gyrase B-, and HSP90-like ATPase [Ekhidna lutea]|uniref:histidine kinase n=1 Tax=Ekhidna lutea TaxID=447679 RepID=A0A239KKG4_EKHLU|nr:sensor histidine kinase [Ekhidna lutea]SNT18867.1 Histidine kinase-, DNA gyrase B-, and HSP90-like ATPase [Ekhidna lutea]
METTQEIDFLNILWPLVLVVFIITISVFLLNQHFQRNLIRQRLQQEELKNQHQKELLKSSIDVQETERRRIARNLHDELGGTLAIARMNLVRLEKTDDKGIQELMSSIKNIRSITESALTSVREISHRLMPPQLESFGLSKALEELASRTSDAGQVEVRLNISEEITRMPADIEVGLYRVCMELLHNTIKHANAKNADIHLKQSDRNQITLSYTDNGVGLNNDITPGLGLKSVEARINAVGGTLTFPKGKGFNAFISIPLEEEN